MRLMLSIILLGWGIWACKPSQLAQKQSVMTFDTTTLWKLKTFEGKPESSLTLRFINFESLQGKSFYHAVGKGPVNGYGCKVEILKGHQLIITELNQTMIADIDPDTNKLEQRLMTALSKVSRYELKTKELSLIYPGGALIFEK
jgi:heat shock protein HslJ